jgi:sulfate adenylyltransferase large subunit
VPGPASNGHAVATRSAELLRLATAGSVDDGKSTLIGRLLHDSKAILDDQMAHVVESSERRGDGYLNLALLTDGLRAEREQGITIDVAYRYFSTGLAGGPEAVGPRSDGRCGRKFIIADTPGHEQYTRNMVTGASTADLSVILVDARNGVVEQTRRHAYISSLLRIPHLVVCVNKMDLVDYDEAVFDRIVDEMTDWAARLDVGDITFIPISALHGDNVVDRSEEMSWYAGPPLLYHLEHVVIATDRNLSDVRLPVQWVIRAGGTGAGDSPDYRGYSGQVAGGVLRPGADVVVLPGGQRSQIAGLNLFGKELESAFPSMSVSVRLADDIDISRGDMIVEPDDQPVVARELDAMVCWMSKDPLLPGKRYAIKHTTRSARAVVEELEYRVNVNTLEHEQAEQLDLNGIGRVKLRTSAPVMVDRYRRNRTTGSFILVDEASNDTVAAGMVLGATG